MVLDDRRAGIALLGLAGAVLLAFAALFMARAPGSAPADPVPPPGMPVPPAAPAPPPVPPDLGKRMVFVLRGTVRGPDGKTPVAGAVVEVVPRAGRRERLVADGKGAFAWSSMDATPAAVVWALAPEIGLGHLFVQGAPGREMDQDVVLAAPRPQPVEARSGDGGPVEGAAVAVFVSGDDAPLDPLRIAEGTTGPDGRCSPAVPAGLPLRFRARSADGKEEGETAVPAAPGPGAPVVVVLRGKEPAGR